MKELKIDLTLRYMQLHLARFVSERGWDKKKETDVFLLFVEEIGELAKALHVVAIRKRKSNDMLYN